MLDIYSVSIDPYYLFTSCYQILPPPVCWALINMFSPSISALLANVPSACWPRLRICWSASTQGSSLSLPENSKGMTKFRIYIWWGDLIEFFFFFISPVPIVNNCDVTILRDDFISSNPCSKAVLIVLIDSRVEVRSSSLQSDEPQVLLLSKWVHLFCSPFDIF